MKYLFSLLLVLVASTILAAAPMFVMQPLHGNNPELSNKVISKASLAGMHVRDKWSLVEPQRDGYSFVWLDQQIARAASFNKQVTLGIYAGTNSPSWLHVRKASGIPLPWDHRTVTAFTDMVKVLGARYNSNPSIYAVHMSSPATYESMEMHLPSSLEGDSRVFGVWKAAIDAYNQAFPSKQLVLDIAMIPDSRGATTKAVDEYARSVLGNRFTAIHCSLKANTNVNAPHHREILRLHQEGVTIGFEMACPSTDSVRFGGTFDQAISIGNAAGAAWYQVYQADVK